MFGLFGGMGGGVFDANYRCYPVTFLDKPDAENGDKVFLPSSALDRLAYLQVEYPMLFKLENRASGKRTHCGVLEFIAEEGMLYMPYWMMQNLALSEGDLVSIRSAALPKGRFVKLQPHTKDFLDISNPRAVLETTLRGYSCLTMGDTICLHYNNKRFYIDIIDAKPQEAISVIETDCEVDFAPPLDYVEPNREERAAANGASAAYGTAQASTSAAAAGSAEEPEPESEPKFSAFKGSGRRLDGKSVAVALPPAPPSAAGPSSRASQGGESAAVQGPKRPAGKVVFPTTGNRLLDKQRAEQQQGPAGSQPTHQAPTPPKDDQDKPPDGFKAFSGKARSLRG